MKRLFQPWILMAILMVFASSTCEGYPLQTGGGFGGGGGDVEKDEEVMVLKIYELGQLINSEYARPFPGMFIPGASKQGSLGATTRTSGGFGGGGHQQGGGVFCLPPQSGTGGFGGGGLGGGGFGGGGMAGFIGGNDFGTGSNSQVTFADRMQHLIDVIQQSIAPDDWDTTNGDNTVVPMQDLLVVTCPENVHTQIDAFLTQLAAINIDNNHSMTIKAYWVFVDENEYRALAPNDQTVDQEVLNQLLVDRGGRAQITCQNRQTVHIASGNLKSEIESVIPVVGSHSNSLTEETKVAARLPMENRHVMAQVSPAQQESRGGSFKQGNNQSIGYQPIPRWVNYGGLLQVSPIVQSDNKVFVNLTSVVILPKAQSGMASDVGSIGGVGLGRQDFQVQQFMNSAVLPLNTPVIVGGSTIQLEQGETSDSKQLYLILEASLDK